MVTWRDGSWNRKLETTSPPTSCEIEIRVRYAEVDKMGVVHHSRFWEYFEMGRTELLRLGGVTYRDMEDDGILLMVVACSAKFSAPARYDDLLVLTTRVEEVGRVKIEHGYVLKRTADGALVARGKTTLGCISAEGKIIPLPPSITGISPG